MATNYTAENTEITNKRVEKRKKKKEMKREKERERERKKYSYIILYRTVDNNLLLILWSEIYLILHINSS